MDGLVTVYRQGHEESVYHLGRWAYGYGAKPQGLG